VTVHNHGTEEGAGLSCNELRLPDGSLRGSCVITPHEVVLIAEYKAEIKFMIDRYARFGIYLTEKDFDGKYQPTNKEN